jgi:hypothetical protein
MYAFLYPHVYFWEEIANVDGTKSLDREILSFKGFSLIYTRLATTKGRIEPFKT